MRNLLTACLLMAILSFDEFAVARGELDGTTPDGGGNPLFAVGVWDQVSANPTAAADGRAFARADAGSDASRHLLTGTWSGNLSVSVRAPSEFSFEIGARCKETSPGSGVIDGYILTVFWDDPDYVFFLLCADAVGGNGSLLASGVATMETVNDWVLRVSGTTVSVRLNGVEVASETDIVHTTGAPYLSLDVIAVSATLAMPTSTVQFEADWSVSTSAGLITWFHTTAFDGNAIYARIDGPEGVAEGSSDASRVFPGFAPNTAYLVVGPRGRRLTGQGDPDDGSGEEQVSQLVTTDGAGNLPITLEYRWTRAGAEAIWSVSFEGFDVDNPPWHTFSHTIDGHGHGSMMGDWDGFGFPPGIPTELLANLQFNNVPVGFVNWPWRMWWERIGAGVPFAPNESRPWPPNADPGTYESFGSANGFGSEALGTLDYQQGFHGDVSSADPNPAADEHIEVAVHDQIVAGDTWWKALLVYVAAAGLEWFKVECTPGDVGPPPPPPPPPGGDEGFVWPMQVGAWRPADSPSDTTQAIQPWAVGATRVPSALWVQVNGQWQVIAPGEPSTPTIPPEDQPPFDSCIDGGIIVPPPPTAVSSSPFCLAQVPPDDLTRFSPWRATMNAARNGSGGIPEFLSALAAADWYLWLCIARKDMTSTGSSVGGYHHGNAMAAIAALEPHVPAILASGRVVMVRPYDEYNSSGPWSGNTPSITEVDEGCSLAKSLFGPTMPIGCRVSPANMQRAQGRKPVGCDVALAQTTTFPRDGFSTPAAFAAGQVAAASALGLSGCYLGMNPATSGWQWSDAFLLSVGLTFATEPGILGLYVWGGAPPYPEVLRASTNAVFQQINDAYVAAHP